MNKDWVGNSTSVYKNLGASNHTEQDRIQNDYYATDPSVLKPLIDHEKISHSVWECACGGGSFS